LTATAVPSDSSARWTWATEALAMGSRSKLRNSWSGRAPNVFDQLALDVAVGERADLVLQPLEGRDHVGREQVGPGAHDLADLDERGSQVAEQGRAAGPRTSAAGPPCRAARRAA